MKYVLGTVLYSKIVKQGSIIASEPRVLTRMQVDKQRITIAKHSTGLQELPPQLSSSRFADYVCGSCDGPQQLCPVLAG